MLQIVADTTPLNYLVLIDAADVLPRIYGRVLIPPSVIADPDAPSDPSLSHLDAGERDAIALATEQASVLLMDERDGTAVARARGLKVVGTLAVLDVAAAHGWIDLQTMFDRLRQTSFRS